MNSQAIQSVCVFCGARDSVAEEFKNLAFSCGQALAKMQKQIVYGGGASGMMGELAKGAAEENGRIVSIYPKAIVGKEALIDYSTELHLVDSMSARKDLMVELSDVFLVLPGGVGTLDELFEVITLKALSIIDKPVIIVNTSNYWDPILEMLQRIHQEGFARSTMLNTFVIADDLEQALSLIA